MSDYFQQLSQQTGIRLAAGREGVAGVEAGSAGTESVDPGSRNTPPTFDITNFGEALPEMEVTVSASDPALGSPLPDRNFAETRPVLTGPIETIPATTDSIIESANLEIISPVSTVETNTSPIRESQIRGSQTDPWAERDEPPLSSQPIESSQTAPSLPPTQGNPSPTPTSQSPLLESYSPAQPTELTPQLSWQALREWLTGAPESALPLESPRAELNAYADTEANNFDQHLSPNLTFPATPAVLSPEPRTLEASESERAQTQDFTLAIGSINLTIEAPPSQTEIPSTLPPPAPTPSHPDPFSAPTRLSRYYLRVR
jgi:hypothetical protein